MGTTFFRGDDFSTDSLLKWYHRKTWMKYLWANRRLGLSVGAFILAFSLSYVLFFYQPLFTSSATLLIKDSAMAARYVSNDEEAPHNTATSNTANPILNTMGLLKTDAIRDALWRRLKTKYPDALKARGIRNEQDWLKFYGKGNRLLHAKNQAGTDFITVAFRWPDPEIAKDGLQTTIYALKEASLQLNRLEQSERAQYMEQRIQDVKRKLAAVRQNLRDFKQQTRMATIEDERARYAKHRAELEMTLARIQADAASSRGEASSYERLLGMPATQAIPAVALGGSETISNLTARLYSLREQYKALRERYTDEHPKVKQLLAEIAQTENDLARETRRTLVSEHSPSAVIADQPRSEAVTHLLSAKAKADSKATEAASIQDELKRLDGQLMQLTNWEKTFAELREEEDILSVSLKSLEEKALESRIREMQTLSNVFVVQKPNFPIQASFPNKIHAVLLGLCLAVFSGLGSIWLKAKLSVSNRLPRILADLSEAGNVPVGIR
ncbi:MAG TPA: hypothetical protein V6C99_03860 [Oculatellaceae cyanobacterium]